MAAMRFWVVFLFVLGAGCGSGGSDGSASSDTIASAPSTTTAAASTTATTAESTTTSSTEPPPPEPVDCEPIALTEEPDAALTSTAELRDRDGTLQWTAEIAGTPTAAILRSGAVLVASDDRFVVLDRSSCEMLFETMHNGGSSSETRMMFLTDHDLRMVSTATGELLWVKEVAGSFSYATTEEFSLIITGRRMELLDPTTKDGLEIHVMRGTHEGFRVADGSAYVFGSWGLEAFSVTDGRPWRIDTLGSINAVYTDNRHVLVDLRSGGFAFVDAATGDIVGESEQATPDYEGFPVFADEGVLRYDSAGTLWQIGYDGQVIDSVAIGEFGVDAFDRAGIVVSREAAESTEWTIWGTDLQPISTFDAPADALVEVDQDSVLSVFESS